MERDLVSPVLRIQILVKHCFLRGFIVHEFRFSHRLQIWKQKNKLPVQEEGTMWCPFFLLFVLTEGSSLLTVHTDVSTLPAFEPLPRMKLERTASLRVSAVGNMTVDVHICLSRNYDVMEV